MATAHLGARAITAHSVQRKAAKNAGSGATPPIVRDVLRSPGQPLDSATRASMECRLGHDFGSVRVHTDARAAESARAISALAYTAGRDVVFAVGQYAPATTDGRRLLALWERSEILRRLQIIRRTLAEEARHTVLCRVAQTSEGPMIDWSRVDSRLLCQFNVLARGRVGGTVATLCVDTNGDPIGGWSTLLHEMVHLSGIGNLPAQGAATPQQVQQGEFETYEGGNRYPNPTPYALRNADSFARFVRDVGGADWTEESNPLAFLPAVEAGPILTLEGTPRPGIGAHLLWTPFGSNLQLITGLTGLFLPRIEERERVHPPRPADLRAFAGAELGLRWIVGGDSVQFVLDVAGGAGPYVTVDDHIDPALMARLGVGLRLGGPQASFGVSAEVLRLVHLGSPDPGASDPARDWLGGLVIRGTWGGTSRRPR